MLTSTTAASSHPHPVSAGRRLDFEMMPGYFAYVYRRQPQQAWQCVARNACSPYFDHAPSMSGLQPEYVVCYCDAAGTIKASSVVVATPNNSFAA
ncbi:hypothetical protein J0X19_14445 [Hymenobacter sp. BT186]|uniref:Uncharacterized protein n=1 Tax=Hymenobacter telluris TaxID=2816474 RepID=A0A939JE98_9BACT|nr:hypothetical protein [Hymenobacter telluris]MBO0359157.1 hypothetical protein [Hymenobacter telluris]MBW3375183.1 hypothetical protein [Hymenobacter norwichensis]